PGAEECAERNPGREGWQRRDAGAAGLHRREVAQSAAVEAMLAAAPSLSVLPHGTRRFSWRRQRRWASDLSPGDPCPAIEALRRGQHWRGGYLRHSRAHQPGAAWCRVTPAITVRNPRDDLPRT